VHDVFIERGAERCLKKIPKDRFNQIIFQIKRLANNPKPAGSRKITGARGFWRIRVGDYRVIYEVNYSQNTVKVFKVNRQLLVSTLPSKKRN